LKKTLSNIKAVGVVDRAVNFGWNSGPVFQEVLSTLYFLERKIPALSFIGGLAGSDITVDHFARTIEQTKGAFLKGDVVRETIWLNEDD